MQLFMIARRGLPPAGPGVTALLASFSLGFIVLAVLMDLQILRDDTPSGFETMMLCVGALLFNWISVATVLGWVRAIRDQRRRVDVPPTQER
jgi:hypothetical protein